MDTTGDVNANESFISTKAVASQESQLFNESFSSTSTTYQRLSTSTGLPSTTTSPAATSQPATANGVDSLLKQLNNPVPLDTPPSDSHQTVESPKSAVKPVIDNQQLLVDFVGEKKPNNNDISNGNHPAVDKGFLESLASPK